MVNNALSKAKKSYSSIKCHVLKQLRTTAEYQALTDDLQQQHWLCANAADHLADAREQIIAAGGTVPA